MSRDANDSGASRLMIIVCPKGVQIWMYRHYKTLRFPRTALLPVQNIPAGSSTYSG